MSPALPFYLTSVAILIVSCWAHSIGCQQQQQQPSSSALGVGAGDLFGVQLVQGPPSLVAKQQNGTLSLGAQAGQQFTPVVFWHGMGDTAYGSINVDRLALLHKYPGMEVLSIQVGANLVDDEMAGYFVDVNSQIEAACQALLASEPIRRRGAFNAVGFSQGAQFLRGLIQRCPFAEHQIKVKNLVSLGGQHQGVYGLPRCGSGSNMFCNYIRHLLSTAAYEQSIQQHVVQAEYWHDPLREQQYKHKSAFLADINNELTLNETYRARLGALENLVLVLFEQDGMVVPKESSLFGFFVPNQTKEVRPLEQSPLYLEDRLGLRQLSEAGKLHQIRIPGDHLQYKMSWFMEQIAAKFLDN